MSATKTFTETHGRGCGLNADWSCSAWRLAGPVNSGVGVYALDNEDGTYSIVRRDFTDDDTGGIQVLLTGTEAQAMAVEPLAEEFARILRSWLTAGEWLIVCQRNATAEYANACASHDYCDANVAMEEAFAKLGMTLWSGDHMDPVAGEQWNAAWTLAKLKHMTAR